MRDRESGPVPLIYRNWQAVHFYDGGSVPTSSARDMNAYLGKLCALMLLDGAPTADTD